jgi:hypothetical protein
MFISSSFCVCFYSFSLLAGISFCHCILYCCHCCILACSIGAGLPLRVLLSLHAHLSTFNITCEIGYCTSKWLPYFIVVCLIWVQALSLSCTPTHAGMSEGLKIEGGGEGANCNVRGINLYMESRIVRWNLDIYPGIFPKIYQCVQTGFSHQSKLNRYLLLLFRQWRP